jgi:hypothetical protein
MSDYRTLENKIRDIVARPWTKDPKKVHHKLQQIQKKIIDEEPEMLNNKALGISDAVVEAAKQINKGKTEVDVNPQYKTDVKDSEDDNDDDKKVKKEELKGKQHKLDKNKNGKVDAHDFKLLRKEEVCISDEEQARLDAIAATFSEDAVQSAQKTAQQKIKAASITAKATVQSDKIKDQARKQAQNNSYEPEGEMVEEGNLAAQIRDAKPSITGHIEVSVGDKKVKIPHRKAQDFLGSYHSKRTPNEKDEHEKAFRKEIGG